MAKVKGIHINKLTDLDDPDAPALPMRGGHVPLRNFTYLPNFAYTKRSPTDKDILRKNSIIKDVPLFLNIWQATQ